LAGTDGGRDDVGPMPPEPHPNGVEERGGCHGDGHADATRARFVALVTDMTEAEYARADWQDVLDHA
jgi:hypothetical protein